jgi:hypothetical protein
MAELEDLGSCGVGLQQGVVKYGSEIAWGR